MRRAGALITAVLLASACGGGTNKSQDTTAAAVSRGGEVVAKATMIDAAVDVALSSTEFAPLGQPVDVKVNDRVRTNNSGFAEVTYPDGSLTRLDRNTELVVLALADGDKSSVRTKMGVGRTWNRVEKLAEGDEFEVETSVATATVRGTAFFIACPDTTSCAFTVIDGTVELKLPDGSTIELKAPSTLTVTTGAAVGSPSPVVVATVLAGDPWLARNAALDDTGGSGGSGSAAVGGCEANEALATTVPGAIGSVTVAPIDYASLSNPQKAGQLPIPVDVTVKNTGGSDASFDVVVKQMNAGIGQVEERARSAGVAVAASGTKSVTIDVELRSFDALAVELYKAGSSDRMALACEPIK